MNILFLILICGLPFGNFLFKQTDIWHGQGHFFQIGVLFIFCWSFFKKPRCVQIINKPLGIFTFWAGLTTSYLWFRAFVDTQHYAIKIFLPFFNFLCFLLFYKLSIEYLNKEKIEKILEWFRYSIILILFYCALQYLNLDEFFKSIDPAVVKEDSLVGTIGNPSHLGGYLAIIQPIYFKKNLMNILSLVLLWLIILLVNSASSIIVGLAVILFWLFMQKDKIWALLGTMGVFGIITIIILKFSNFFSSSSRLMIWKDVFVVFQKKAITGYGLGSFSVMKFNYGVNSNWRHLHNEYYQIAFELGLIGLILLFWCIFDYFKMFKTIKTDLTIRLATIFFGFCLLALFTFNSHLWLMATVGMMVYSFLYTIKNEELI